MTKATLRGSQCTTKQNLIKDNSGYWGASNKNIGIEYQQVRKYFGTLIL